MKFIAPTLFASFLLIGCSSSQAELHSASSGSAEPVRSEVASTVKPGAAVEFGHKVEGQFSVGQFSDIIVTAMGDNQALNLSAQGTENLDVGTITALSFDEGEAPSWRISVRPKTDGVHYLNLFGIAKSGERNLENARVQSIRIDLGGRSADLNEAQKPTVIESENGAVAVFEAEETSNP